MFYPKRNGDYVYDVTVAKDEAVRLSHRYRAHLDHAERIENGRLPPVQVEVADEYGPTVTEAVRGSMRALTRGVGSTSSSIGAAPPCQQFWRYLLGVSRAFVL
jgi:hypothetical protein